MFSASLFFTITKIIKMRPALNNCEKKSFFDVLVLLVRNWKTLVAWVFVGAFVSSIMAWITVPAYEGKIDVKMALTIYPYSDSSFNELRLMRQEVEAPRLLEIKLINELRSNEALREACGYKSTSVFSNLFESVSISAINKYSIVTIKNRQDAPGNIDICLSKIYNWAKQDQRKLIDVLQRPLKQAVEDLSEDINESKAGAIKKISNNEKSGAIFEAVASLRAIENKIARLTEFRLALDSSIDAQMLGESRVSAHPNRLDRLVWLVIGCVTGLAIGLLVIMVKRLPRASL